MAEGSKWQKTYWGDKKPKGPQMRQCISCPATFKANGPKKRCAACADAAYVAARRAKATAPSNS